MLILISGLPGTGKTTIAHAFTALSGATHLNSDVLRRELGLMGHYSATDKEQVYMLLNQRVRAALSRGETVVVDSTFFKESLRAPYRSLAIEYSMPIHWVEVQANEDTLRDRLQKSRPDSEADFAVYEKIRDQYEPILDHKLIINTDRETPDAAAVKIQQFIA
jgi:predicted kinase